MGGGGKENDDGWLTQTHPRPATVASPFSAASARARPAPAPPLSANHMSERGGRREQALPEGVG